eukprot:2660407-Rhodomonas_salina.1
MRVWRYGHQGGMLCLASLDLTLREFLVRTARPCEVKPQTISQSPSTFFFLSPAQFDFGCLYPHAAPLPVLIWYRARVLRSSFVLRSRSVLGFRASPVLIWRG